MTQKEFFLTNPVILFALLGLYLTSLYSFLLFHTLAEFFSILVAFSLFTISWNARRLLDGSYLVLLGVAYLCVGGIDILHTLAFKGMGVFPGYDTNLPTQFWIAARYMEALSFITALLFIKKKVNPERTFAIYFAITFVLIASIFGLVFPDCYIEGIGLTQFKKTSEYVICVILFIAVILIIRKRSNFEPLIFSLMIASIVLTIATELSFISYVNVYGYEHIIGHILKVLSFYLMYRAIVVTSIINPYDSLFWDLNQSKERLRLFIEHAPASLAMFDRQMRYLSVSRRWLSDYKLGERDVIGVSHYEVFPEIPEYWKEIHRRGLAGEVVREDQDRFVRADGSEQWVRWELRPWRDAADEIAGIVIFSEDITERKRVEGELRESQSRLDLALRSAHMGVWHWDIIENRRRFDDQVCHLLGINPAKFTGTADEFFNAVHPDDRSAVRKALERTIEQDAPYETEYRTVYPDGSIHHIVSRGRVVRDDSGQPVTLNGIIWEITERKRMEEEQARLFALARQRNAETEAVFEAINDAVLIYDTNMNVQRVNPMFIPTYGFDPVGLNVRDIIERTQCRWPDGRPLRLEDQPTPRALRGETVLNQRFLITRSNGVEIALETSSGPLHLGDQISGTVTVWHDITDRKRMEEELLRSRNELEVRVRERTTELQLTNRALTEHAVKLERLNEELRDFAFIASHDLQEPVRKIQILGDMLMRRSGAHLDEGGQDCIMRMAGSAKQMGALIQSLLDYSRLSTRLGPPECVDLSCVVQEIIEELKPALERIAGHIEVGALPVIEADGAQMRYLFQHLVENSIKFSKNNEAPAIKVRGQRIKDHFKITVEDNGMGFDESYLDRIFRPFQQLHEKKGQYDGTGMGLAICRKIAELHGGTITARSTTGVGSIFTVSLPIINSRERWL